jgi:hypothetical protein
MKMKLTETTELLRSIAAIDNRKVNDEVIQAWHQILGQIPFDIAKEALKLAQQDASIKYLEPRHIFGWAKEAAFRLDRNKVVEAEVLRGSPEPTCKHDKKLLSCKECCRELSKQSHLISQDLHAYAKENIYG